MNFQQGAGSNSESSNKPKLSITASAKEAPKALNNNDRKNEPKLQDNSINKFISQNGVKIRPNSMESTVKTNTSKNALKNTTDSKLSVPAVSKNEPFIGKNQTKIETAKNMTKSSETITDVQQYINKGLPPPFGPSYSEQQNKDPAPNWVKLFDSCPVTCGGGEFWHNTLLRE